MSNKTNEEIAKVFDQLAGYEGKYLNPFAGKAFQKTAAILRKLSEPFDPAKPTEGIWKSSTEIIKEFLSTGAVARLANYEQQYKDPTAAPSAVLTKRLKRLMSAPPGKADASPPQEWIDGRIVLKPPARSTTWRTQSYLSKHQGIPTSLFKWFTSLLPESHLREVDYGYYKVQEMTGVAACLLVENRGFFEQIRSSRTRRSVRQHASQRVKDMSVLKEIAAHAGSTTEEVLRKHERLAELAASGNIGLIAEMLASLGGSWVHETLLVGAGINDEGRLLIGEPLRRLGMAYVKSQWSGNREVSASDRAQARLFAEAIGVLALSQWPDAPDGVVRIENIRSVAVTVATFSTLARHVFSRYPDLRPCVGDPYFFCQVDVLDEREARALARYQGPMDLNRVSQLTAEVAAALAEHRGDLDLSGVTHLTAEVAAALASHQGELKLGPELIADDVAAALAEHKGSIKLWKLTALTGSTGHLALVKSLVRECAVKGVLEMRTLATMPKEIAAILARFPGTLELYGIVSLPLDCAEALARHAGTLEIGGLETLEVAAAKALAGHRGTLSFCSGWSLAAPLAKALAAHAGVLRLDCVKVLSDEAAAALSAHRGPLSLSGLGGMKAGVAKHLSQHEGGLSLRGLLRLTNEDAEQLAAYKGKLSLPRKIAASVTRVRKKALESMGDKVSLPGDEVSSDE